MLNLFQHPGARNETLNQVQGDTEKGRDPESIPK